MGQGGIHVRLQIITLTELQTNTKEQWESSNKLVKESFSAEVMFEPSLERWKIYYGYIPWCRPDFSPHLTPHILSSDKSSYLPNISWIQPFLFTSISTIWTRLKVTSLLNYCGGLCTALSASFFSFLKFILNTANRIILLKT